MNQIVSAEWLNQNIDNANLRILDVRFLLGNANAGHDAYVAGHLPGAIFLDLEKDLSGPVETSKTGGRHPLPKPEVLAEKLGSLGIGNNHSIVCYDDPSTDQGFYAAHAWWLLHYLGHDNVRVLDGGLPAFVRAGGKPVHVVQQFAPTIFKPNVQTHMVVNAQDVMQRDANTVLIDSRAPARYRGEIEPIDPVAGHIPGAINLDWASALNETGEFKNSSSQQERISDLSGTDVSDNAILYCGSGVSACANILAFALAGKTAKLYAGSWSDWISDAGRAVEKTSA